MKSRVFGWVVASAGLAAVAVLSANAICKTSTMPAQKTIRDRIDQYGQDARKRLKPSFAKAGVGYPPKAIAILGLKEEKRLEIQAKDAKGKWRFISDYPILCASGDMGPKLKRGDLQVPEGIYRIELLNPNSLFHLSLRVNYPNAHDKAKAKAEGRNDLGGDIMIHGSNVSIGCLAMGDPVAEELFVLAHDVGLRNIKVILAPKDLRGKGPLPKPEGVPAWTGELYKTIRAEMRLLAPRPTTRVR